MSCYGTSMKQDLAAGTQLFFYQLFFSQTKNTTCHVPEKPQSVKAKCMWHVASPRRPSSFCSEPNLSQRWLCYLNPKRMAQRFDVWEQKECFTRPGAEAVGQRGRRRGWKTWSVLPVAVRFPPPTPPPPPPVYSTTPGGQDHGKAPNTWSRGGEENDPGAGRQMWSFWSVLGSECWKNGLWAFQEVLFSIGGMDDSFLELNEGRFREIH